MCLISPAERVVQMAVGSGLDIHDHVTLNKVSFVSLPQNEGSMQEPSNFPISTIYSFWTMQFEPAIEFIYCI